MKNQIRNIRIAKGMTLHELAQSCNPPTTAQTIGRLETGKRTVSTKWLERISDALSVNMAQLLALPDQGDLPIAAILDHQGAHALKKPEIMAPPVVESDMVGMRVKSSIGDYRAGDDVWLSRIEPDEYMLALNRDILVPRPAGRFLFGRLIGREGDKLQLLPLGAGSRQQIVKDPSWIGLAKYLIRAL